jgi:hypothetical protein
LHHECQFPLNGECAILGNSKLTILGSIDYLTQPEDVDTVGEDAFGERPGPGKRPTKKGPINGSDLTRREAADYIAILVDELKSSPRPRDYP